MQPTWEPIWKIITKPTSVTYIVEKDGKQMRVSRERLVLCPTELQDLYLYNQQPRGSDVKLPAHDSRLDVKVSEPLAQKSKIQDTPSPAMVVPSLSDFKINRSNSVKDFIQVGSLLLAETKTHVELVQCQMISEESIEGQLLRPERWVTKDKHKKLIEIPVSKWKFVLCWKDTRLNIKAQEVRTMQMKYKYCKPMQVVVKYEDICLYDIKLESRIRRLPASVLN